jgi:hypothetical protein
VDGRPLLEDLAAFSPPPITPSSACWKNAGIVNANCAVSWRIRFMKIRKLCRNTKSALSVILVLSNEIFLKRPVAVSQHRRLCAGANHPPLTHRSRASPSAQAPSLSSPDEPITPFLIRCPVRFILSTLDGDARVSSFGTQGRRNGNLPRPRIRNGEVRPFTLGTC